MKSYTIILLLVLTFGISKSQNINRFIKKADLALKKGYNQILIEQNNGEKNTSNVKAFICDKKNKSVYITDSLVRIISQDTMLMVFINKKTIIITASIDIGKDIQIQEVELEQKYNYELDKSLGKDTVKLIKKRNNKTTISYLFVKNKLKQIVAQQGSYQVKTTILKSARKPFFEIPDFRTYFYSQNVNITPTEDYKTYKINNSYFR